MINKTNKNAQRRRRHLRVRKNIFGTKACPRLNIYRSTSHIYAQVINDENGTTLCSASTLSKELAETLKNKTKSEQAFAVGELVGKLAIKKGIKGITFLALYGTNFLTAQVKRKVTKARVRVSTLNFCKTCNISSVLIAFSFGRIVQKKVVAIAVFCKVQTQ